MNEHSAAIDSGNVSKSPQVAAPVTQEPAADLFVINLCASMTPMPSIPKSLKGFDSYKLYQISKMEDGRRRYRLRLGFFTSEADAELAVSSVRSLYPAAFTGCLTDEDFRYVSGGATPAKAVAVDKPALVVVPTPPPPTAAPAQKKPATAAPIAAQPRATVADSKPVTLTPVKSAPQKIAATEPEEITLELDSNKLAAPAPVADTVMPFHVAKGVVVPEVGLEFAPEPTSATAPEVPATPKAAVVARPAAAPVKSPPVAAPATKVVRPEQKAGGLDGPLPPPPRIVDDYIPVLDTTLTLRTLTQAEVDDPNQPTWFVVELALSEHPVNLETMPKLDIFAAYTLYSVATMKDGGIRHALRLGFFREAVSAEAVAGYLKTFFATPGVTRISAAEHTRFADPPKKVAPTDTSADKVVQLKDKRPVTAPIATPNAAAAAQTKPPATPKSTATAKKPTGTAKLAAKGSGGQSGSLAAQLREEARQTLLSESSIRKAPKPQSFLSRLIGRSLD